jgi:uncharacterized damage-inducible protein DinB
MMENDHSIRNHIVALLRGGQAYDTFEEIAGVFAPAQRSIVPDSAEHSAWQILEHIRIAQRDILDFIRNEDGSYVIKRWPEDYWPIEPAPPDENAWDASVAAILTDRSTLEQLVLDPGRDLVTVFPWGDGQTLLREALLVADHSSYHLGQLVILFGLFST